MDQLKSNENTNRCIVDSPAGHSLGCAEMLSLKQDHSAKTGHRTSTKLLAFYVHVLMFLSKSHQKEQSCSRVCNSYDYVDTIQSHAFSDNGPDKQVGLTPQRHIWRLSHMRVLCASPLVAVSHSHKRPSRHSSPVLLLQSQNLLTERS